MYNLVGFQTNLKFGEQKRVFGMIPALSHAEYVRYGVMHRNSFIDSPRVLNSDFSMKKHPKGELCRADIGCGRIYGICGFGNSRGVFHGCRNKR